MSEVKIPESLLNELRKIGQIRATKQGKYPVIDVVIRQKPKIKEIRDLTIKHNVVIRLLGYYVLGFGQAIHVICTPNFCYSQLVLGINTFTKTPNAIMIRSQDVEPLKILVNKLEEVMKELTEVELSEFMVTEELQPET